MQVVEACFGVVVVTSVTEGVDICYVAGVVLNICAAFVGDRQNLTVGVVLVLCYETATAVDAYYVPLDVFCEGISVIAIAYTHYGAGVVIEIVQRDITTLLCHYLVTVKGAQCIQKRYPISLRHP